MLHYVLGITIRSYLDLKPFYVMCYAQIEFYKKFQSAHLESVISQRVFGYLKPFFVKPLKDKNTCCCIYHVKLNELRLALNLLRTNSLVHDVQLCDYHYGNLCGHDG